MFDAGLMHRDIRPENLLLTNSNFHTGDLKYADFGLAQYANMATTNCGTEYYKAPEVQGNVRYDYRADLWSIGVVIYELAIGKNPFIRCKNNVELHAVQKSQFLNNEDYVRYGDSDIKMIIEHLL
jgi:serine/threonine-protein kinase ULK/ATG1